MNPRTCDASVEKDLCGSLLKLVQNDRRIEKLREELGGFTHRCRNLLNGMKMSLYFVRRGAECPLPPWWDEVERNYQGIESLLDELQSIYCPMFLTPICARLGSLVHDRWPVWSDWFATAGASLSIVPPAHETPGQFDPMYLCMGLDVFVRWRASAISPEKQARLIWRTANSQFEMCWQELALANRPHDRTSGATERRASSCGPCTPSLALPLLARVMTAHQGTMQWSHEPDFRVQLRWPLNLSPR